MAADLCDVQAFLDDLLEPGRFDDYCPNGLQVEGRGRIRRLVSGVTACQALIDAAVDWQADAILVHHGFFWRGEDPCVRGLKRRRLATLLGHDVSLLAYHLPLDAHPEYGNNAQLGRLLGLKVDKRAPVGGEPLVCYGLLPAVESGEAFAGRLRRVLGSSPLHIGAERNVERVAWCTGAAQGFIDQAVAAGVDAFVTGEVSEPTVHIARESGIHFFAAGHHATERYGVQAVGDLLATALDLEHRFIDIDNPV